ncbi:MAG: hypothetical protein KGI06_00630 [Candidatus Micrarchaeota archaeon]|nr:hypothetical protein [Candidatus Micrarchaeota archaeon]
MGIHATGLLKVRDLDIRHTVESAQPLTFHADYDFAKGTMGYASDGKLVSFTFNGNGRSCNVRFDKPNAPFSRKDFEKRFRLKDDINEIYSRIATDEFVSRSVHRYRGMRVTLNDPWETTLCFIMSQYNNVKRIRLIVRKLIAEFGTDIVENGNVVARGFPRSEDLLSFTERDFRMCGTGFRAKYLKEAAEYCTNNIDLYSLSSKGYDEVKEELMGISGVGDKVADCIALMGYGKMEAFPIDVWVKRTLERVYFKGRSKKIKDLHRFVEKNWDNRYLGYLQQYIFWGGRNLQVI